MTHPSVLHQSGIQPALQKPAFTRSAFAVVLLLHPGPHSYTGSITPEEVSLFAGSTVQRTPGRSIFMHGSGTEKRHESFVAQRNNGIYAHGSLRWDVSRQAGNRQQYRWNSDECCGSVAGTPYTRDAMSRANPKAVGRPAARPAAVVRMPLRNTIASTLCRGAPNAMRMPISCVCSETTYAVTP